MRKRSGWKPVREIIGSPIEDPFDADRMAQHEAIDPHPCATPPRSPRPPQSLRDPSGIIYAADEVEWLEDMGEPTDV